MKYLLFLPALLSSAPAMAEQPLPVQEASAWLQRMSDASRNLSYEGVFILGQGDKIQTLQVKNRPSGNAKESRLVILDGQPREVRCMRSESVSVVNDDKGTHLERRIGTRHFPDLLPDNAAALTDWYAVRLAGSDRVGGLDCQQLELAPKDRYRWGYVLCADKRSGLPLKAVMVNDSGQPLRQYSFAEVHLGSTTLPVAPEKLPTPPSGDLQILPNSGHEIIQVRQLPPGFSRIAAMKRTLPNHAGEVQHWVFSDGLTHISLFLKQSRKPTQDIKGNSQRGMVNLLTRQVGNYHATVVGDAPWPAVEAIASNLTVR